MLTAKERGYVRAVGPIIDALEAGGFRAARALKARILARAGEE